MQKKYDLNKNNMVKAITGNTFLIKNGLQDTVGHKTSYELYDRNGKLNLLEHYYLSGNLKKKAYFDKEDFLEKEVYYDEDGKVDYEFRYSRDIESNSISKIMFLGGNEKWNSVISEFDMEGKKICERYKNTSDQIVREDFYKYDNSNNLILIEKGSMGTETYEYNENNQLKTKTIASPSGTILGEVYSYFYSDQGLLQKIIKQNEYVIIYSYEFF